MIPRSLRLVPLALFALACERGPGAEPTEVPTPPPSEARSCPGPDALDAVWTAERREQLATSWAELPGEWPAQLLETIDARVGERGSPWREDYREACTGEREPVMRCLDIQRWRLDAALTLAADDPSWAERIWPEIDAALPGASACAEPPQLELTESTDALGLRWATDRLVRRYDDGGAQAEAERAESRGDVDATLAALDAALEAARSQADPWVLVDALHDLGAQRLGLARDPQAAVEPLTEAIALSTRIAGAESPRAAEVQQTLAGALMKLGKIEAAYDLLTQARDSFVLHLGPDHPRTLATVESIGHLFFVAGQPGDAQYAYLDLLDIYDQLYGPKHWRVARVKVELGDALMAMEQHEGARKMYTEALTPIVKQFGPDDRDAIRSTIHLGIAELALGNLDQAEVQCARGVNLAKALAVDDPLADEAARCMVELAAARKRAKKARRGRKAK